MLDRIGASWRDAGRDIALIVVSILIAFALDAWWDRTLDRGADESQVRVLRDEMEAARRLLERATQDLDTAVANTTALLALMGPRAEPPERQVLLPLLVGSLNLGFPELRGSVVETVLSSRNPLISGDLALMRQLERWSMGAADLSVDAEHIERNRDVDLQRALVDAGFPGFAVASAGGLELPESAFPLESAQVVRSNAVYAALYYRAFRLRLITRAVAHLNALTDSIVAELDERVGGAGD